MIFVPSLCAVLLYISYEIKFWYDAEQKRKKNIRFLDYFLISKIFVDLFLMIIFDVYLHMFFFSSFKNSIKNSNNNITVQKKNFAFKKLSYI